MMINAANLAGLPGKPDGSLIKATVSRGPDGDGTVTLKLAGGREAQVQVGVNETQLKPGQNVLISPADGKIFIVDGQTPEQAQASASAHGRLVATVAVNFTLSLEHIHAGFESALMKSLPAESLERVFDGRGGADIDALNVLSKIDKLLQNRSVSIDPASPSQLERIEQWLRIAIDNPKLVDDLIDRMPIMGAREAAELIDRILALLGEGRGGAALKEVIANLKIDVNTIVNAGISANRDIDTNINTNRNVNTDIGANTGKNPDINTNRNADANRNVNTNAAKNIGTNAVINRNGNADTGINAKFNNNVDTNIGANRNINTNVSANNQNINRNDLIASLLKTAFSSTPAALLDLIRQIDTGGAAVSAQRLRPEEARKIVSGILAGLPAQTPASRELLYDARLLSPQNTKEEVAAPQKTEARTQTADVARQIRSEYPALTVAAARSLLDVSGSSGGNAPVNMNAIGERLDALKELVNTGLDRGPQHVAFNDGLNRGSRSVAAGENGPAAADPSAKNPPAEKPAAADVSAVKREIVKLIDTLRSAVDGAAAKSAQTGTLDIGEKLKLLGLVRNTVSSIDDALRPLTREERPAPQSFYDRVVNSPERQVSAETKNAVFERIGAAQESIRRLLESIDVKPGGADGKFARQESSSNIGISANKITPPEYTRSSYAKTIGPDNKFTRPESPRFSLSANSGRIDGKTAPPEFTRSSSPGTSANVGRTDGKISPSESTKQPLTPNVSANIAQADGKIAPPKTILDTAQRVWAAAENMRAGFREAFSALDLSGRVSPLGPSEGAAADVIRQSADALRTSILLEVSGALREIFSSIEELRASVLPPPDGSPAMPAVEEALYRAVRDLEQQARAGSSEVMDRLKDILKELNRLHAEASRPQDAQGAAARTSPADVARSTALTVARSLESLSLLAAQTRGTDAQQQVVALPVKMGQEWTEVHIKFVKDRGKGKNKEGGNGRVSIYLNTAPSALGGMTAHFDFHPPTSLKLSMRFEMPEATKWFKERSAELREALAEAGLPGVAFDFRTKRAAAKKDAAGVGRHGGVIRNDKVDFKA